MSDRVSGTLDRVAIIWLAATLLMLPAFVLGHIISDNSFLNVNWSEGFSQQLFSGHVYPRWLPAMNAGTGSPVFYFYAPLPFYLTAPFHLLVAPRFAVLLGMWLMLALSGQAFHALAVNFVQGSAALLASLAYMAMPYHLLVDVWLRSDFGELGAYIFIPLCLLCAFRLASGPTWTFALAASLAGLFLSHLPSALLFAPFLVAFCLYAAVQGDFVSVLVRAATAAVLGLGLAAAYVLPALLLQNLIHAGYWDTYRPSQNLLFTRRTLAFELLLDAIAICALGVIAMFSLGMCANKFWRRVAPWAICAAIAILLTSPGAQGIWNALPSAFEKIQFAWRALLLLDVASCMIFALALDSRIWRTGTVVRIMLFGPLAVAALFFVYENRPGDDGFRRRTANAEEKLIAAHVEPLEYLPACRPFQSRDLSDGTSTLIVEHVLHEKAAGEIAVFHYPFLNVYLNGKLSPTKCDPVTGFVVIGSHTGQIDVGTHALAPERIGAAISIASIFILCVGLVLSARAHRTT